MYKIIFLKAVWCSFCKVPYNIVKNTISTQNHPNIVFEEITASTRDEKLDQLKIKYDFQTFPTLIVQKITDTEQEFNPSDVVLKISDSKRIATEISSIIADLTK